VTAVRPGRVAAIVLRQLYLLRGSVARAVPLFSWVAVDMVLWGFLTRWLDSVAAPGTTFVPTLLGAILLWDFFTRVMQGVAQVFFEDVWSRNFLNLFASPLTVGEYLAGLVTTCVGTSAVSLLVMVLLAGACFGLWIFALGAVVVPYLVVLFVFGIALGIVGSAIVLRLGPSSEWFVWPIPALVSPFAGVFYPVATLPGWMQALSKLLPPSYVFESLRAVVRGGSASYVDLALGGALAVVDLLLACMLFRSVHRRALRSGLIARYAAETVT
jgi:ABC-2 type transport system permease protein